jgi:hypothetical protein
MQFAPDIGLWSPFIFWFVVVNAFVSLAFILVVTVGGVCDVQYLLRSIGEESDDAADDGRVMTEESGEAPPNSPEDSSGSRGGERAEQLEN